MESKGLHVEREQCLQRDGDDVYLSRAGVIVREMVRADVPFLMALRHDFLTRMNTPVEHDHPTTAAILMNVLGNPSAKAFVAITAEGRMVGMLVCEATTCPINSNEWMIVQRMFYVDPVVRGQGIGRHLIARMEDWAREEDIELLVLCYREGQVPDGWFEQQGFQPIERTVYKMVR